GSFGRRLTIGAPTRARTAALRGPRQRNRRRAWQARHGPRGVARTIRSEHASAGEAKSRQANQKQTGTRCVSHELPRRVLALQNDVKEWRGAGVAEALTRATDGHTR